MSMRATTASTRAEKDRAREAERVDAVMRTRSTNRDTASQGTAMSWDAGSQGAPSHRVALTTTGGGGSSRDAPAGGSGSLGGAASGSAGGASGGGGAHAGGGGSGAELGRQKYVHERQEANGHAVEVSYDPAVHRLERKDRTEGDVQRHVMDLKLVRGL